MNEMTNSHILIHRFDYLEPATLEEAAALLAEYGPRARVVAGGTDLLVHLKMERSAPEVLISIGQIPGLERITATGDALHLGARATIRAIEKHARVRASYTALHAACASFSTTQVQTMGTVGGNLANGSPASDTAPALIALGAEVQITGAAGTCRMPLEDFFLGPGKTALQAGELLVAVILPRPAPHSGSAFLKISRVAADIAKASAAAVLVRDGDRIAACRMAFGSVAPRPLRTPRAEALLAGQPFSEELILQAAQAAAEDVAPIDDVRSTAAYRREAVRVLAHDALVQAWHRSGEPELEWAPDKVAPAPAPRHESRRYPADEKRLITLRVNGEEHLVWVRPNELLLNVLREQLQLTGTKYGCGIGECSACTVQMDGAPVLACLVLALSAAGKDIVTVEGLQAPNGDLDPLQAAFVEYAAYQCGYCTPGMLLTARSLLAEQPRPSEDEVRHYLRGNLCRCTGYASVVRAVLSCAEPEPG